MYDDKKSTPPVQVTVQSPFPAADGISFCTREIRKGICLPCYKRDDGDWMVPVTIVQQMHFPDEKLIDVEHTVSVYTNKNLQKMTKAEIREVKLWLKNTEGDLSSFARLTESEYACSCNDLDEQYEKVEKVFMDIPFTKKNSVKSKIQTPAEKSVKPINTKKSLKVNSTESVKTLNNENKSKNKFSAGGNTSKDDCSKYFTKKKANVEKHKLYKSVETNILRKSFTITSKTEKNVKSNGVKKTKNTFRKSSSTDSIKSKRSIKPKKVKTKHYEQSVDDFAKLTADSKSSRRKKASASPISDVVSKQSVVFLPSSKSKSKTPSVSSSSGETSDCGNSKKKSDLNQNNNSTASCFSHVLDELEQEQMSVQTNKNIKIVQTENGKKRFKNSLKEQKVKNEPLKSVSNHENHIIYSEKQITKQNNAENKVTSLKPLSIDCTQKNMTQIQDNDFLTFQDKEKTIKYRRGTHLEAIKTERSSAVIHGTFSKPFSQFNRDADNLSNQGYTHSDCNKAEQNMTYDKGQLSKRNNVWNYENVKHRQMYVNGCQMENTASIDERKPSPENSWQNKKFQFEKDMPSNNNWSRKSLLEDDRNHLRSTIRSKWQNRNAIKKPVHFDKRVEPNMLHHPVPSCNGNRYKNIFLDKKPHYLYNSKPDVSDVLESETDQIRFPFNSNVRGGNFEHMTNKKIEHKIILDNIKHSRPLLSNPWIKDDFYCKKPMYFNGRLPKNNAFENLESPMYDTRHNGNLRQGKLIHKPFTNFLPQKYEPYHQKFKQRHWVDGRLSNFTQEPQEIERFVDTDARMVPPFEFADSRSISPFSQSNTNKNFEHGTERLIQHEVTNHRLIPFNFKHPRPIGSVIYPSFSKNKFYQNSRYKSVRKAQMVLRRSMSKTKVIPFSTKFQNYNFIKNKDQQKFLLKKPIAPWHQGQKTRPKNWTFNNYGYHKFTPNYSTKSIPQSESSIKSTLQSMGHSVEELIHWIRAQQSRNSDCNFQNDDYQKENNDFLSSENHIENDAGSIIRKNSQDQIIQQKEKNNSSTKKIADSTTSNTEKNSVNSNKNDFVTLDEDWDGENENSVLNSNKMDTVKTLLDCRKIDKELEWPFRKSFQGWNEIFQDFNLNNNKEKEKNLTTFTETFAQKSLHHSRNNIPFQWKKKLIRKAEIYHDTAKALTSRGNFENTVKAVLDEVLERVSANVTHKSFVNNCLEIDIDIPLAQTETIVAENSLQKNKALNKKPVSDNYVNSGQVFPTNFCNSLKQDFVATDDTSKTSDEFDGEKVLPEKSLQVFDAPKYNDKLNHDLDGKEVEAKLRLSVNQKAAVEREVLNDQTTSVSSAVFEKSCYRQIKQEYFPEIPSHMCNEPSEKSSDETLSDLDSETISLRNYAKAPNQKKLTGSEALKLRDCIVSIEYLNLFTDSFSNVLDEIVNPKRTIEQTCDLESSPEQIETSNNSLSKPNPLTNSSKIQVMQKARKTIRKPQSEDISNSEVDTEHRENSNQKIKNKTLKNQTKKDTMITKNKTTSIDQTKNNISFINKKEDTSNNNLLSHGSDLVLLSQNDPIPNKTFTEKNKYGNIALRLRSARFKNRPRLPSMSSDEENLTPQSEELASSLPSSTIAAGESTDDDQLLISCKPFLSKNSKKRSNPKANRKNITTRKSSLNATRRAKQRKVRKKDIQEKLTELSDFVNPKSLSAVNSSSVKSWVCANINAAPHAKTDDSNIDREKLEALIKENTNEKQTSGNKNNFSQTSNVVEKCNKGANRIEIMQKQPIEKSLDASHEVLSPIQTSTTDSTAVSKDVLSNSVGERSIVLNQSDIDSMQPKNGTERVANSENLKNANKTQLIHSKNCENIIDDYDPVALDMTITSPIKLKNSHTIATPTIYSSLFSNPKNVSHSDCESFNQLNSENTEVPIDKSNTSNSNPAINTPCTISIQTTSLSPASLAASSTLHANSQLSTSTAAKQNPLLLFNQDKDTVLSPIPHSLYGETYHHGMMEIQLSAPSRLNDFDKTQSKTTEDSKLVFITRRIPYIQLKVEKPNSEKQLATKTKKQSLESKSTLLVRIRDVAFSLRIDCVELLSQIAPLGIPCYIPNEYTQSVYNFIYNSFGQTNKTMSFMLGFHRPIRNGCVNEDSMINLNDYLKIILPNFYLSIFGLYKNSLPEYVSVTTYKPIDVVTPFVIKTFSNSYAHNVVLISNDIPIQAVPSASSANSAMLQKRGAKRKCAAINGISKNRKKQRRKETSKELKQTITQAQVAFSTTTPKSSSHSFVSTNVPNCVTLPSNFARFSGSNVVSSRENRLDSCKQNPNYRAVEPVVNRYADNDASINQFYNAKHKRGVDLSRIKFIDQSTVQLRSTYTSASNTNCPSSSNSKVSETSLKTPLVRNEERKTLGTKFVEDLSRSHAEVHGTISDLHELLRSIEGDGSDQITKSGSVHANSTNDYRPPSKLLSTTAFEEYFANKVPSTILNKGTSSKEAEINRINQDNLVWMVKKRIEENQRAQKI